MNAPWIDSAVEAFGRHFGFAHFALNERGAAAARFENGASIALESTAISAAPTHADSPALITIK